MSGISSQLIALAGWNFRNLKVCENYRVIPKKWVVLPALNAARFWPESILLNSKRAFCFCGGQIVRNLNSIESLNLESEGKWKTLPLNAKIPKTWQLAAVEYTDKIVVFGGHSLASFNLFILSREGELEQDLSNDPLIPGAMCRGSLTVRDENIYAVGSTKLNNMWDYVFRVFDGKKWSLK